MLANNVVRETVPNRIHRHRTFSLPLAPLLLNLNFFGIDLIIKCVVVVYFVVKSVVIVERGFLLEWSFWIFTWIFALLVIHWIVLHTLHLLKSTWTSTMALGLLNSCNVSFNHVFHLLLSFFILQPVYFLLASGKSIFLYVCLWARNEHFFRDFLLRYFFVCIILVWVFLGNFHLLGHFLDVLINVF